MIDCVKNKPAWTPDQLERMGKVQQNQTVVSKFRQDAALLAWANEHNLLVRIDRKTEWGNPFPISKTNSRANVCAAYAEHIETRPDLLEKIPSLKGKVLVCWCHPQQCHGDHLAALANGQVKK